MQLETRRLDFRKNFPAAFNHREGKARVPSESPQSYSPCLAWGLSHSAPLVTFSGSSQPLFRILSHRSPRVPEEGEGWLGSQPGRAGQHRVPAAGLPPGAPLPPSAAPQPLVGLGMWVCFESVSHCPPVLSLWSPGGCQPLLGMRGCAYQLEEVVGAQLLLCPLQRLRGTRRRRGHLLQEGRASSPCHQRVGAGLQLLFCLLKAKCPYEAL